MTTKKEELYARIASAKTGNEFCEIPDELLQAARNEEQQEHEAKEDAYWKEFSDFLDEHPICRPHGRG